MWPNCEYFNMFKKPETGDENEAFELSGTLILADSVHPFSGSPNMSLKNGIEEKNYVLGD